MMRRAATTAWALVLPMTVWAGEGRLALSPDGVSAWMLSREGIVTHLELDSGRVIPWAKEETNPPRFGDIAPSADGRALYTLLTQPDGRSTRLQALDTRAREETSHWEVRGEGRFLVVSRDGARACVIGLKPSAAGRHRLKTAEDDWTLTVVDLVSGKVSAPVAPGLEPRAVALMEPPGSPPKILLATKDRVVTYSLDPLRASWFYRSRGDNLDIAAVDVSSVVCVLRGSTLAVIDPTRRPREKGRVQLSEDDDATAVVMLPARGRALALTRDGAIAAVLHDDGLAVTFIDLHAARVTKTETLGGSHDLIARRILGGGVEPLRLALASSLPGTGAGSSFMTRVVETPPLAPSSGPTRVARAPETPAASPVDTRPPPVEPQPNPEPARQFEQAPTEPAPVEADRADSEATLSGRLIGDVSAAREVLFFGPNNILKLIARARVGPDGAFHLPLPPPGSYRVVVSAGPQTLIFTRPEYRTVTVTADTKGLKGIDFEVRGKIR